MNAERKETAIMRRSEDKFFIDHCDTTDKPFPSVGACIAWAKSNGVKLRLAPPPSYPQKPKSFKRTTMKVGDVMITRNARGEWQLPKGWDALS